MNQGPSQPGDEQNCVLRSFWMAGFESACHINSHGQRLDMIHSCQHDTQVDSDYALLRSVGIRSARDGVRWHLIETSPGNYDFSSLIPMLEAALRQNVQIVWNLCHYGWPKDIDLFSPAFVERFANFCRATARIVGEYQEEPPVFVPVNEISYFAWAIGTGGYMFPYALGRDTEVKRQLVRAAIAACDAVWEVDPRARFIQPEPIIHVIPPRDRPDLAEAAAGQHASQFQTFDMLTGRVEPELGGHPRYLDIVGVNYYHSNQWEHPDIRIRWEDHPRDERWVSLHQLMADVYERYRRPLILTETSHFGVGRPAWIREIADEAQAACQRGLPLLGVCLYPIIDRHDWETIDHWHNSGLWDVEVTSDGVLRRVLNVEYAQAFDAARRNVTACRCDPDLAAPPAWQNQIFTTSKRRVRA